MKWELRVFQERPGAMAVPCRACGRSLWLPPSKVGQKSTCDAACAEQVHAANYAAFVRACETCGVQFRPRPTQVANGVGRFCSQACNTAAREALWTPEALERRKVGVEIGKRAGRWAKPKGPDHPKWKGGAKGCRERQIADGRAAAVTRRYRAANPDKVREFTQRRYGRLVGKLPYGTLPTIRKAQRDRCAICRVRLKGKGHVDHIMPLARGGQHEPRNIQLLCPPCNLRKNARDPITHMQSLGRLL